LDDSRTISVRGRKFEVAIDKVKYDKLNLAKGSRDFAVYLISIPSLDGINLDRDEKPSHDIEL
jgi:hypothetical protein